MFKLIYLIIQIFVNTNIQITNRDWRMSVWLVCWHNHGCHWLRLLGVTRWVRSLRHDIWWKLIIINKVFNKWKYLHIHFYTLEKQNNTQKSPFNPSCLASLTSIKLPLFKNRNQSVTYPFYQITNWSKFNSLWTTGVTAGCGLVAAAFVGFCFMLSC